VQVRQLARKSLDDFLASDKGSELVPMGIGQGIDLRSSTGVQQRLAQIQNLDRGMRLHVLDKLVQL